MTDLNEQMRAEFEAWAKEKGYPLDKCEEGSRIGPVGAYKHTATIHAWEVWQAARQHGSAAQAVEPKRRDIFAICDAYESGIGHGLQRDGHKSGAIFGNPECGMAYEIGYEEGEERSSGKKPAVPPVATQVAQAVHFYRVRGAETQWHETSAENIEAIRATNQPYPYEFRTLYTAPPVADAEGVSEREAFEKDAAELGMPLDGHGGHYSNIRTRNRWLGWQARAALSRRPAASDLKAEHIDAIHALGRDDPAVHAFLNLKLRDGLEWSDVLAQMVLHLAADKAGLTARLMEIVSRRPAAEQSAAQAGEWRDQCETLLDIWDDLQNPPESRCYIGDALRLQMEEVRELLAAPAAVPQDVDAAKLVEDAAKSAQARLAAESMKPRGNMSDEFPPQGVEAQAADVGELPPLPEELTPMLLLNAALCIEGEQVAQHKKDSIVEKLGRCAEALQERHAALKGKKP